MYTAGGGVYKLETLRTALFLFNVLEKTAKLFTVMYLALFEDNLILFSENLERILVGQLISLFHMHTHECVKVYAYVHAFVYTCVRECVRARMCLFRNQLVAFVKG